MSTTNLTHFISSLAIAVFCAAPAFAQSTTRVSVNSVGVEGNNRSFSGSISADGRFIVFYSDATNLVPGDTTYGYDIFVHDRQTSQTTRVSVDSSGVAANSGSYYPAISADGRYVAFSSYASNLVPGDTNGQNDVFVHDRQTGQTSRVSVDAAGVQGNAESFFTPAISADGRYVAFQSLASNLVSGDTNGRWDIFVHDRQTGLTTRVSVDSAGMQSQYDSSEPSISADGRFVSFDSYADNFVPGDTNGRWDVFVHDCQFGQTTRVSVDSAGVQGNGDSGGSTISADGRYVTFISSASNLVAGDTNDFSDIFIHDRQTSQTTRVSVNSAGVQGNSASYDDSSISADGRYVAFESPASNLVFGDTNGRPDIFVHDRQTGQTTRVSVDSSGVQGNRRGLTPSLSADGRYVAFSSNSTNLVPGDTNGAADCFVHDRGATGLNLTKIGSCPGALNVTIANATPHGNVAFLTGPSGIFVKQNPPCQGISLSLNPPTLRGLRTADQAGGLHFMANAPPQVCGLTLQAVDVSSCTSSNTVVL